MKRHITLTSVLILAMGLSGAALAQEKHGPGGGNGPGKGHQERGGGPGPGRGDGPRADGPGSRGPGPAVQPAPRREERRAEARMPTVVRELRQERGRDVRPEVRREVRPDVRREVERNIVDRNVIDRNVVIFRRDADRGLLTGCPPGLARRDNGCLPPGQARRIERARDDYSRYDYLWRTRGDDYRYRYQDGYVYRSSPQGGLLGYLPVLGGVLSPGNAWPGQYAFQQAPQYYSQYYGLNDRYQYRYADGVLYGVDPQTQGIGQIAALLTGQQFNVGQRMPAGYDVYNVPYGYRDQYVDSAQSQYRYNDGYVYQVDPTTQLVQAVIQLLT